MVNFSLTGGLGNQLFTYTAGIAYASSSGEKVQFLVPPTNERAHEDSDIRDFNVEGKFLEVKQLDRKANFHRKLIELLPFVSKIFGLWASTKSGYDSELLNLKEVRSVAGNFQTFKYAESLALQDTFRDLHPRVASEEFRYFQRKLSKQNTVAVHVRRGDYLQFRSKFGVLNDRYFDVALKQICKITNEKLDVYVFSDDLAEARRVVEFSNSKIELHFLEGLNSLSAAETLLLMSLPKFIIISNSTFSWWAAFIGRNDKQVIVPYPWFRAKSAPEDLIPNSWIQVPASWEV